METDYGYSGRAVMTVCLLGSWWSTAEGGHSEVSEFEKKISMMMVLRDELMSKHRSSAYVS